MVKEEIKEPKEATPKTPRKKKEELLTIDELLLKTGVPEHKMVGALVAAGKQRELELEREKHPTRRKAFMTESEFRKYVIKYED
jgi:hypothetical protein